MTNAALSEPKQNRFFLYLTLAVAFFAVEGTFFFYVDKPLAAYIATLDTTSHDVIDFFRKITDLGKGCWYLWPCGIATIFCSFLSRGNDVPGRYRRLFGYVGIRAYYVFAAIGISGIVANIIKMLVGRARPVLWFKETIYGFDPLTKLGYAWNSMPSGHSTTAFALAFSLAVLYPRGRIIWFFYALLLSLSRVMVNAHYLSDVCAGAALGGVTVWLFTKFGMAPTAKIIFPIDNTHKML
mgnify:CR=1 FL=1